MLFTQNITINQPLKKLNYKMLDLFEVIRNKKVSIELQLLQLIKIHNTFPPNLLKNMSKNLLINWVNELSPPSIINIKE